MTAKSLERKASLKIIEGNRETIANGSLTFTRSTITVSSDVTISNSRLRSYVCGLPAKFSRNYARYLAMHP